MVEFHDAIITDIAMGAPCCPENVACLTELEFEYDRGVHLVDL